MENNTQQQIDELEIKIDKILLSTTKTERYMKITFWATIVLVVLPAVLLAFVLPGIMASYTASFEGLLL
jgi:hypothetical protein